MILLSLCRNKGYLSWTLYGEGYLQERETVESVLPNGLETTLTIAQSLERALKATNHYLESRLSTLPKDTEIVFEVSSQKIVSWLFNHNIADKYKDVAIPAMLEFQKLPFPVRLVHKKNPLTLTANKYNQEQFLTPKEQPKVFKATDIF